MDIGQLIMVQLYSGIQLQRLVDCTHVFAHATNKFAMRKISRTNVNQSSEF